MKTEFGCNVLEGKLGKEGVLRREEQTTLSDDSSRREHRLYELIPVIG